MPATTRIIAAASLLMLAGCAATRVEVAEPEPSPLVTSSGLVIGTLSYQFVDSTAPAAWVVHFERIDGGTTQDYALPVEVDAQRHEGLFTGALPAGVYAFRDISSAQRHFDAAVTKVPFELQAGEVKDTGHYAVKPQPGL